MDDDEGVVRGPFGERSLEPFETIFGIGIEKAELGAGMLDRVVRVGRFADPLKRGGLLALEWFENALERRGRAIARNVVIAFGEKEWRTQPRVVNESHCFAVLFPGELLGAAQPLDEVADLQHETDARFRNAVQAGDGFAHDGEKARQHFGGQPGVIANLAQVAGLVFLQPGHVMMFELVEMQVAEEDKGKRRCFCGLGPALRERAGSADEGRAEKVAAGRHISAHSRLHLAEDAPFDRRRPGAWN